MGSRLSPAPFRFFVGEPTFADSHPNAFASGALATLSGNSGLSCFRGGAGFRQLLRVLKKQSFVEHLPRPFPPLLHGVPEPGTFDKLNKSPNKRPKRTEVPRPKNATQIGAEGRLTPFLRKKIFTQSSALRIRVSLRAGLPIESI